MVAPLPAPGRYSLDRQLGIRVSPALVLLAAVGSTVGVALTLKLVAAASAAAQTESTEPGPMPAELEGDKT